MNKQLELIRVVETKPARPPNPTLEESLAEIRAETLLFVETAIALGLTTERDTKSWPNEIWIKTRVALEAKGAIAIVPVVISKGAAKPSRPPQPYRPHSEDRKQRARCTKVIARHLRRLPLGGWWMDAVQDDLLLRPWYFGVCSLPSEGPSIAPDYKGMERQRLAIAREVALREQELARATA